MPGLIAALDTTDPARARTLARALSPWCGMLKLGLEFYLAHGPAGVRGTVDGLPAPCPVFLDLKLHDIPNTVAGAVRAVLPLRPRLLTLHAAGGAAMVEAARRAAEDGATRDGTAEQNGATEAGTDAPAGVPRPGDDGRPLLIAVTVLTSLDAETLHATGVAGGPRQQVLRLARLALSAGADGLVCGVHETAMLRDALGAGPVLVVPGIRPAGAAAGDQARTGTPRQAAEAGADWIVVGRPITAAPDPAAAAAAIAREIA